MPTPLRIWLQDSDLRAPQSLPGAQVVWFGWDWKAFHGELLKAQAAGDLPDIVEIGDTWVSRLKAEGLLLDVTRFATERLNATLLFFPRTLRQCVDLASSRYYALPLLADVRVLFYNEDYVGPHLAAHPTAFQDWRAFEEMCQAVQESLSCAPSADFPGDEEHPRFDQGERYAIAWPLGPDAYHDALPWIWTMGGDVVSESGEVLLDSPRTQQAITRLARLILTGCAPVPPYPPVKNLGELRTQFRVGRLAMMAGSLWVMHGQGTTSWLRATLHPSVPLPTAFVGGSHVAIVRKHGDDEASVEYEPAKLLVEAALTSIEDQVGLAGRCGKMPCNMAAWQYMRQRENNATVQSVFDALERAMCWTTPHGLPEVANLVDVEEALKACMHALWRKIGDIKRSSPGASLETLEEECARTIAVGLAAARQRIEPFLTGCTVEYNRHELAEMGLQPPGIFDIWIDSRGSASNAKGDVYVKRGPARDPETGQAPVSGMGQKSLQLLRTLVNAPRRRATREALIKEVWGYNPSARDHQRIEKIDVLVDNLKRIVDGAQVSDTRNRAAVLFDEIKYITTESDIEITSRAMKLDALRHCVENLNKSLGTVRGRSVIEQLDERGEISYVLNPELAVCVVVP